jgi:hypothetical protein
MLRVLHERVGCKFKEIPKSVEKKGVAVLGSLGVAFAHKPIYLLHFGWSEQEIYLLGMHWGLKL